MKVSNFTKTILLISAFFIIVFLYLLSSGKGFVVDEETHSWMISTFFNGNFIILDHLTVIPGYHVLVAAFQKIVSIIEIPFNALGLDLIDANSIKIKRGFSVIVAIASSALFYKLHEKKHKRGHIIKTLQYATLPIIFHLFFLIYTDVVSLTLILLGIMFFQRKRYLSMGIMGLLSLTIRQSNIIWVLYLIGLTAIENSNNFRSLFLSIKRNLKTILSRNVTTGLAVGLFSVFVVLNQGIALGDKEQHPAFSFRLENLYVGIFLILLVNLPLFISYTPLIFKKVKSWLNNSWGIIGLFSGILGTAFIFFSFFEVNHPYNNFQGYYWILRNAFLHYVSENAVFKLGFFISIIYGTLALIVTPMKNKLEKTLLYSFAALSLIPFWLIEVRYAIIAIVIFHLLRKPSSNKTEYLQLAYNTLLSMATLLTIIHTYYFP